MFSPSGPYLFVGGEFAALGCCLGTSDRGALVGRKWHGLGIAAGKLKEDAADVVLNVGR